MSQAQKTATTQHPILDCLAQRWSPRAFTDQPVERDQLRQLFEAARWAASAFNEQPWRFIVATNDQAEHYDRVLSCLVEANQAWAKAAPVLVITAVSEVFKKNGKDNRCAEHDLGLAMGNLSAQATALDLVVHQMAGIDQERAQNVLQIPGGYHAFSAVAIGHPGAPEDLPEGWMRESEIAPRDRAAFDDFVFACTFGEATGWF
ncbi:MAG: nitroreductase family protein [Planctomycetota bacterium]